MLTSTQRFIASKRDDVTEERRAAGGELDRVDPASIEHADRWRRGAVLVPIFTRAPHGVIFVERARHLRHHPGQIGFPGGSAEPLDAGDPVKTALRELFEELAIGAEHVSVVGRLPDLEQVSNRFLITPVVGLVDANARLSVDGDEIVGVFTIPLKLIVADGAIYEDAQLGRVRGRSMYAFDYDGRRIWGFTARILKLFAEAWIAPASALRGAIEAALHDDP